MCVCVCVCWTIQWVNKCHKYDCEMCSCFIAPEQHDLRNNYRRFQLWFEDNSNMYKLHYWTYVRTNTHTYIRTYIHIYNIYTEYMYCTTLTNTYTYTCTYIHMYIQETLGYQMYILNEICFWNDHLPVTYPFGQENGNLSCDESHKGSENALYASHSPWNFPYRQATAKYSNTFTIMYVCIWSSGYITHSMHAKTVYRHTLIKYCM